MSWPFSCSSRARFSLEVTESQVPRTSTVVFFVTFLPTVPPAAAIMSHTSPFS